MKRVNLNLIYTIAAFLFVLSFAHASEERSPISAKIAEMDASMQPKAEEIRSNVIETEFLNPKRPCLETKGKCQPRLLSKKQQNELPIHITADSMQSEQSDQITYSGDVELQQGAEKIISNTMIYNKLDDSVIAEGNAYFYDGEIEGITDKITHYVTKKEVLLEKATYQFLCSSGRGDAKVIQKDGLGYYQMEDGTYTTCPVNNNSWHMASTSIERIPESNYASLYNNTFQVLGVPLFYLPYLRVPVTKDRLTGFLYPTVGLSSRDGTTFEIPFYWNIAPQYDLTVTPYVMSKRGVQLQSEFRYISPVADGHIKTEYIHDDKHYPDGDARWGINLYNYKRSGHWRYTVDYSKVSDTRYFAELPSDLANVEESTLLQTGEASYYSDHWQISLMARNFQPLTNSNKLYRVLPKLSANYNNIDLFPWMKFSWENQFANFQNDSPKKPSATRFHSEPSLRIPFSNSWLALEAQGKLYYSHYEQEFNAENNASLSPLSEYSALEKQVDRVIPSLRLTGSVTFDRKGSLLGLSYLQVLEPKVQYLYTSKVDQSGIYNPADYIQGGYDSSRLQMDYYGLFRENSYSSVDYIAPANQLAIGVTSRFYNSQMKERFNLSIGQVIHFSDHNELTYSTVAADTEMNYGDFLFIHSSAEYNPQEKTLQYGNSTVELRKKARYIQLSYRYVADEYIIRNLEYSNARKRVGNDISLAGVVVGMPLSKNISVRAQYFYDLKQKQTSEGALSMNFVMDCWSFGVNMGRNMLYQSDMRTKPVYENNVSISIALLGLGGNLGIGYDLKASNVSNILRYGDPFNLRY